MLWNGFYLIYNRWIELQKCQNNQQKFTFDTLKNDKLPFGPLELDIFLCGEAILFAETLFA